MNRLFLLILLVIAGCSREEPPARLSGRTMGTTWTVACRIPPGETPASLSSLIQKELDRTSSLMSTYDPASEISRFNSFRSTGWFSISADTARVVAIAQEISLLSGGMFDVTVAPLVDRWGFGPEKVRSLPSDREIKDIRRRVGFRHLSVRSVPPALRKGIPDLRIDLSAVAKGYGVDRVAALLRERGIESFMVEVGGEVVTRGTKPDGSPWLIGIERPIPGERVIYGTVTPGDGAVATSGNYRNFLIEKGERYGHVISPSTGYPVRNRVASVTVVDQTCLRADGLATALLVLGEERGVRLAEERGVAALFLLYEGESIREVATSHFLKRYGRVR